MSIEQDTNVPVPTAQDADLPAAGQPEADGGSPAGAEGSEPSVDPQGTAPTADQVTTPTNVVLGRDAAAPGTAPTAVSRPPSGPVAARPVRTEENRFPRGLVIRIFVYLVGAHLFAAFLFLLFWVGGSR